MIERSLIDLIPEVGHTMIPLIWLLGLTTLNSLNAKSVLAGEKLVATYSIST